MRKIHLRFMNQFFSLPFSAPLYGIVCLFTHSSINISDLYQDIVLKDEVFVNVNVWAFV